VSDQAISRQCLADHGNIMVYVVRPNETVRGFF
jgi:hypothetical protein